MEIVAPDLIKETLHQNNMQHSHSAISAFSQVAKSSVLEQSKVIIIRHANSMFNKRWNEVEQLITQGKANEDSYLEVVRDLQLLDCPLSDIGIQQCLEASKTAHQLTQVQTIFVSPLRRALQTAYLLFKDHQNFKSLRFIVHPLLRENMHTVCDIPDNLDVIRQEYTLKIPHLDFSLMNENENTMLWWYVDHLQDPVKTKLLEVIKRNPQSEHHKHVVLNEILQTYPDRIENAFNTHQRSQLFKTFLKEYREMNGEHQIAVVGHSMHFSYMTATEWELQGSDFDYTKPPTKFRFLANCEFYPFDEHLGHAAQMSPPRVIQEDSNSPTEQ